MLSEVSAVTDQTHVSSAKKVLSCQLSTNRSKGRVTTQENKGPFCPDTQIHISLGFVAWHNTQHHQFSFKFL